jgi:glyoxylase-like metal-dependent hydrolase (beta-lactamase superfamily II)
MGGIAGNIFKPGGLSGILGNLKNSVYNSGGIIMGPGVGTTAAGIGGPLGAVAGVASSPAAGMASLRRRKLTTTSRKSTGDAVFGGHGPEDAAVGDDAVRHGWRHWRRHTPSIATASSSRW